MKTATKTYTEGRQAFKNLKDATKRVLSVSHEELQRRIEEENKNKSTSSASGRASRAKP